MMRKPPFTVTINADGTIDQGAEATLRWYFADKDELEIFTSLENGSGLGILSKPLSDRNELDVQSFLASTETMKLFDCTCQNDPNCYTQV